MLAVPGLQGQPMLQFMDYSAMGSHPRRAVDDACVDEAGLDPPILDNPLHDFRENNDYEQQWHQRHRQA
jgi:hypothetical protein